MRIEALVEALGGVLIRASKQQAGEQAEIRGVSSIAKANGAELVFAEDARSAAEAMASGAGAVVLRRGTAGPNIANKDVVEAAQPKLWFARAARLLLKSLPAAGVDALAVVGEGVSLGEGVTIGACAVIGAGAAIGAGTRIEAGAVIGEGVRVGGGCRIYPRVVVYPGTTIGDRVVLQAGVVVGADGFGYVRDNETGAYTQFPQQGTLVIEDEVEIGANSTVDRGALEETRIGKGTKIDNLVHVGHNCTVGENVILVALTGISGSSEIGDGAVLAGQVGIGDHVRVGPGVILGGQSGVFNGKTLTNEGVKPGTVFFGTPARPLTQVMRETAVVARLVKGRRGNKE